MKSQRKIKARIKELTKSLDKYQGNSKHNKRRAINIRIDELERVLK